MAVAEARHGAEVFLTYQDDRVPTYALSRGLVFSTEGVIARERACDDFGVQQRRGHFAQPGESLTRS
jgi:hypothetical protein